MVSKAAAKGMVTLSVVSSLLLITTLFSFAVIQTGTDQIKTIQNTIIAKQHRAQAKASLDCAIAVISQRKADITRLDLALLNQCKLVAGVRFSLVKYDEYWQLTAINALVQVKRIIAHAQPLLAAFMTTGHLRILEGNTWQVAMATSNKQSGFVNCLSVVTKGQLDVDLRHSSNDFITEAPLARVKCFARHSSRVKAGTRASKIALGKDIIQQQTDLALFEMFFHRKKTQWPEVKLAFDKVIVTGSAINNRDKVVQCGAQIKQAIAAGHELIWVEGDCLLNGASYSGSAWQSPLVVIANGVVGATVNIVKAKFSLLQFTANPTDFSSAWGITAHQGCRDGAMQALCAKLAGRYAATAPIWSALPFYFSEPTSFEGGYFIDAVNSISIIDNKFSLNPDAGLLKHKLIKGIPSTLKGSLHDF